MNWKYIDTSWIKRLFSVKKKPNTIPKQEKPFSNGRYVASYEGRPDRNVDRLNYPGTIMPYAEGIDPFATTTPDNVQFGGGDFGGSGASSDWGSSDSSSDSSSYDSGSSDSGSSDCGGCD